MISGNGLLIEIDITSPQAVDDIHTCTLYTVSVKPYYSSCFIEIVSSTNQGNMVVRCDISIYRINIERELDTDYQYPHKPTSNDIENRY